MSIERPLTVLIAGVGLIGGSVAIGAKQHGLANHIIGFDKSPGVLDAARGLGVIDQAELTLGEWVASADLIVVASPSRTIPAVLAELLPYAREDAVITDVGSVKEPIVEHITDPRYIGSHPMAGSEHAGVLNADAGLLENAIWALTPAPSTSDAAQRLLEAFVRGIGARPLVISAAQHDRVVATVSHLPYVTAVALTKLVENGEDSALKMLLAAGGFRDLTRVASGDPVMSRDMIAANRDYLRDALRTLKQQLDELATMLDDPEPLERELLQAKRVRDAIPIVRRSLLPALYEIIVPVADRPGEFARITNALADAEINIKDLEVLNIRESGGAVRLAFGTGNDLVAASSLLTQLGYSVRGS